MKFKNLKLCPSLSESTNEVKLLGQIGSSISDESATIFSVVTNTDLK